MKTILEIVLFVAVTLGPIALLWLRVEREKRRRAKAGEDIEAYLARSAGNGPDVG